MFNRLIMMSVMTALLGLMPAWLWLVLGLVVLLALVTTLVALVTGSTTAALASDLDYQCDSAIGPDTSITRTLAPGDLGRGESAYPTGTKAPSEIPTTNPYASLTVAPDDTGISDWQRTCVTAMRSAPYQLPLVRTANTGRGVECARELALAQLQLGSTDNSGSDSAATLTRSVVRDASTAALGGRCAASGASADTDSGTSAGTSACARTAGTGVSTVVVLPNTVGGQALCGQRVSVSAVSAGDLVFWDYSRYTPTRVGVAVGGTRMVTVEPGGGRPVEEAVPTVDDVRIKRVLPGASS